MKEYLAVKEEGDYCPSNEYVFFETEDDAFNWCKAEFEEELKRLKDCSNYDVTDYNVYKGLKIISLYYTYLHDRKSIEWKVIKIK